MRRRYAPRPPCCRGPRSTKCVNPPNADSRMFSFLTVALLAWGALAFGAEYSWAYAPLVVLAVTVGSLGLLTTRGVRWSTRPVVVALGVILILATVTTIPL